MQLLWLHFFVWQKELNCATELDEAPFSDPVELQDVIDVAKRFNRVPIRIVTEAAKN